MSENETFEKRLMAEDQSTNILHSCCGGNSDKRLITIMAQVIFSGMVLIFAAIMLAMGTDDGGIYLSLITSVTGYWLGKNETLK